MKAPTPPGMKASTALSLKRLPAAFTLSGVEGSGKVRVTDAKTVYVRLPANYFEPKTLLSLLRKVLSEKIK